MAELAFAAPPHGLQGLQLFAAQGLQPFAAHGLQPFFAAHGLQPFFAAHGLQPFAAQGLQPFFAPQAAMRTRPSPGLATAAGLPLSPRAPVPAKLASTTTAMPPAAKPAPTNIWITLPDSSFVLWEFKILASSLLVTVDRPAIGGVFGAGPEITHRQT